jgi:ABC-type nickel/cobalt efflux system permease component RcnA
VYVAVASVRRRDRGRSGADHDRPDHPAGRLARTLADMGRRSALRILAAALAISATWLLPATVAAHPLGNFTINHYAGLTIAADRIDLDIVIDMAEIPAFQERQTMDTGGDGSVADDEAATWAVGACAGSVPKLDLRRDGSPIALAGGPSSVAFPAGAGGLSTLRLECGFTAALSPVIGGPATITFADTSYTERLGWREIIATGDGTILDTHGLPAASPSRKLTAYPADLIATPLDTRSATIDVQPDPAGPRATSPAPTAAPAAAGGQVASSDIGAPLPPAAVPGGVAADLPDIFRTVNLTPFVILASLLTAVVIGAGHALTPGHGKTLMAAYLVGSRGTPVHAVGLGLSVAVSHTLGILALALVIVGAGSVLPPDVVYRVTPLIAGGSIVAIGGWMLFNEVRRRRARRTEVGIAARVHEHVHGAAEHADDHNGGAGGHEHEPGEHSHDHEDAAGDHGHGHEHEHDDHDHGDDHAADPGVHSHGGVRHSHLPPAGSTLSWRGLFVLGLAGGLIPSTSALIILLGSIAAGRPAFGLVLVVAFGLGMAAVMTTVGLVMIVARTRLDRMPSRSSLGRLAAAAPLLASMAVLALGLVLTWQAVAGRPVL